MEKGLFIVSLTVTIALSTCAAMGIPDGNISMKNSDVYLQLLQRVENLEKRDQQQQAEIDTLRGELNTEKQRSTTLEEKLARLQTKFVESNVNDDVNTASVDTSATAGEEAIQQKQDDSGTIATERTAKLSVDQTSTIRRHVGMPAIAFYATLSSDWLDLGVHQNIAFNRVITNIGAAYNSHVGTFIAPVAGIYVFHTTIMVDHNHYTHLSIMRNGVAVANMYVNGHEAQWNNGGAMVVLHLNKGDDVTVQNHQASKAINGDNNSMFSGFLLYQDGTDGSTATVG